MSGTAQHIADQIGTAIRSQALPAGTRLAERELAEIFGVSRAVIKQALVALSEAELVDTRRHSGASVAVVGESEARELFEALVTIEQGIAFLLMEQLSPAEWDRLEANVSQVDSSMRAGDNTEADRIGPHFHDLFVELCGNRVLQRAHARIAQRVQLLRQIYVSHDYCRRQLNEDHRALIAHLRAGELAPALTLIRHHYRAIARGYDLSPPDGPPVKLAVALASCRVPHDDSHETGPTSSAQTRRLL